jgi:hypothetical protein
VAAHPEGAWRQEGAYRPVAAHPEGAYRPVAAHPEGAWRQEGALRRLAACRQAADHRAADRPAAAWRRPGAASEARCSVHWPRWRPMPAPRSAQSFSLFRSPWVKKVLKGVSSLRVVLKILSRQGGFARAQGPPTHSPVYPVLSHAISALYLIGSAATRAFAL